MWSLSTKEVGLRINVHSLAEGENRMKFTLSKEIADFLIDRPQVEIVLMKAKKRVHITGKVCFKGRFICARCAEEFEKEMEAEINVTCVPPELFVQRRELELTQEEIDTVPYYGDEIDLEEIVRDTILLSIPIKMLCKPDCKGLCPICGKNLNEGPCEHQK